MQQTTVAAVIDYFNRFLQTFPDLKSLAGAQLEEVLTLWAGLGYYSRARNLHKAAQLLTAEYAGQFPQTVEELQRLPGVGRSTAGAIACLAFDLSEPILDGNVRRVLIRLLAITDPARDRAVEKQLWIVAERLVPEDSAHDYTQAIMDLGATVCTPKHPDCEHCPLASICLARTKSLTDVLPLATKRKRVPTRRQAILMISCNGRKLVRRRKAEGLLGGMLEFPVSEVNDADSVDGRVCELLADYGCAEVPYKLGSIRHTYSHFRLEADVYEISDCDIKIEESPELYWQSDDDLDRIALHGAHKKALVLSRDKRKRT